MLAGSRGDVGAGTRGKRITGQAVIAFAGPRNAAANVAGLPAAARAVREAALAGLDACVVAVPGLWTPDAWTLAECRRLAGPMEVTFMPLEQCFEGPRRLVLSGEAPPASQAIAAGLAAGPDGQPFAGMSWAGSAAQVPLATVALSGAALAEASRAIIRTTSKPGDGIISRYVNRPISKTISRQLLRLPRVRPVHGTIANAAIAVAMVLALLLGGDAGLIAGAVLFQLASILDGVDGELARATFRATDAGAALDSGGDAATNIGFIGGVVANVALHGDLLAAQIGGFGLGCMAFGMLLLGLRAKSMGVPLSFNAVKHKFNTEPSKLRRWLTWLTMRDFYAFAGALLIVCGLAGPGLMMFAAVAAGWLVVVIATLLR